MWLRDLCDRDGASGLKLFNCEECVSSFLNIEHDQRLASLLCYIALKTPKHFHMLRYSWEVPDDWDEVPTQR